MLPAALRSALLCLALGLASGAALAQPAPAVAEDARLLPYAEPGQMIDIGGRRINLRCSGSGGPTVVLMAGLASWSPVWYRTQPEIAKKTRVCAFDRAAYGFSDPPSRPQGISDVADDLHAALRAANESAPYVLVGHSLGGLEVRLFAQRWPDEVAGMILLDTSAAADVLIQANLPYADKAESHQSYVSSKLRCILLAARGPLDPAMPGYGECVETGLPSDTPAALRKVWPKFYSAEYSAAELSLLASLVSHRYDGADHLKLGAEPLIVLSADVGKSPAAQGEFWYRYRKQWFAQHEALARMSARGVHRIVADSGHEIELDKPQAVIDAVDEVLRQLPAGRAQ